MFTPLDTWLNGASRGDEATRNGVIGNTLAAHVHQSRASPLKQVMGVHILGPQSTNEIHVVSRESDQFDHQGLFSTTNNYKA